MIIFQLFSSTAPNYVSAKTPNVYLCPIPPRPCFKCLTPSNVTDFSTFSCVILVSAFPSPPQVYWCGPILGGIVAAMVYENIFAGNASLEKTKGYLLASRYESSLYDINEEKPSQIIEEDKAAEASV